MTELHEQESVRERVRFDVSSDGAVDGDDGADHLGETLRYVCRMGNQIGALLDTGELERLSTMSSLTVTARVAGAATDASIKVEVEAQEWPRLPVVAVPGMDVQDAIDRALRRVTIDLTSDWAAIITDESRLVGVVEEESSDLMFEVGLRVLAILGALGEALRETAVRLDFVRGSLLLAAIGEHALYTHADKFHVTEVVRTVAGVQCLLADANLARARVLAGPVRA